MTFLNLIERLKEGKTFEKICKEQDKNMVECTENAVFLDDDLEEFLEELGAEIIDTDVNYIVIDTKDGFKFEIPYKSIPNRFSNRFDKELPDEIILNFKPEEICIIKN